MDAVWNANWLVQYDVHGNITSKPPLYTWLAAGAAILFGGINRFTLTLPAAVATASLAILIAIEGRRRFGTLAGALAGWFVILSPLSMKLIAIARPDMLFALLVTLGAIVALRAVETGRGWTLFWLIMAAGVLTKGPLAIVLAAMGLLAIAWERRTGDREGMRLRGSHWIGLLLFMGITLGWFIWAWSVASTQLTDKMLRDELMNQAVGKQPLLDLTRVVKPTLYFIANTLPWSILVGLGLRRIWKQPAESALQRRFERFAFCWFLGGLLLFSLATHQRADLLAPLLAPGAWIAGREATILFGRLSLPTWRRIGIAATIVAATFLLIYQELRGTQNARIALTVEMRRLAQQVRPRIEADAPLYSVDVPFAFQYYMQSGNPVLSVEAAADILAQSPAPIVAVSDQYDQLREHADSRGISLTEVANWPDDDHPVIRILTRGSAAPEDEQPAGF